MHTEKAPVVFGFATPEFEGVRAAFSENFEARGELGASLCIYVDGVNKVDLWGGTADESTGRAWERNTIAVVYSATKGVLAVIGHMLAERGTIDFDAPVAAYWPEFASNGKSEVPVRYLFTHQVGLPFLDRPVTLDDVLAGDRLVEILEHATPVWKPGSAHGYHALTFGWLVATLLRKACGRPIADVLRELITEPLSLDLTIGRPAPNGAAIAMLRDDDRRPDRVPDSAAPDAMTVSAELDAAAHDPGSMLMRTMTTNGALPVPDAPTWNQRRIYGASIPAAGGITNARSLARMYAATIGEVNGTRLLSAGALEAATREQVAGPDRVLLISTRFATGFQLPSQMVTMLSGTSFGHSGVGGALGFADTRHRVAFGYVPNQLRTSSAGDDRTDALLGALRSVVG